MKNLNELKAEALQLVEEVYWAGYYAGAQGQQVAEAHKGLNYESSIADLGLRPGIRAALVKGNITTIRDLCDKTEKQLQCLFNYGSDAIEHITSKLSFYGFSLKSDSTLL